MDNLSGGLACKHPPEFFDLEYRVAQLLRGDYKQADYADEVYIDLFSEAIGQLLLEKKDLS